MDRRIRLTDPRRASDSRRAVEDSIPYPGTVNQPERKFKKRDQYDIDWETVNHPYPDMRTEWKNDSRDEIGFGIPEANGPTVASVRVAANQAVRVAILLLGEKVSDEVIEAQARDFMAIGPEAMARTLDRFSGSQELYVAEDDAKEDDKDDSKEDDSKEAGEMPPQFKENAEKKKEEAKKDDSKKDDSKKDDSKKDASDDGDEDDKGDKDEGDKEASAALADANSAVPGAIAEPKKADDDGDEDDEDDKGVEAAAAEVSDVQLTGPNEMDIELTSASSMDFGSDEEADPRLASLFEDESIPKEGAEEVQASARAPKAGIKTLGGQPRAVTASQGVADIGSIWDSAPDVSDVFR